MGECASRMGCCVIVAFRSAKGLHRQNHSFRGAKGDNGRVRKPGDVASSSPFAPRKVCIIKITPFAERLWASARAGCMLRHRRLSLRERFASSKSLLSRSDNGRVREPGGCCVIVAFRSAKGLHRQNHSFRGATMGECASRVDVVSSSPFAPRKVCIIKIHSFRGAKDIGRSPLYRP